MRRLIPVLVLLPGLALAQVLTVLPDQLAASGRNELFFSQNECSGPVRITWTFSSGITPCSTPAFRVWVTAGGESCGNEPNEGRGDRILEEMDPFTAVRQGTGVIDDFDLEDDLPFIRQRVDGGAACPAPRGTEVEHSLCASLKQSDIVGGSCTADAPFVTNSPSVKLTYDALPPDPPTLEGVESQEEGLIVRTGEVFDEEDATFIRIQLRGPGDADFRTVLERGATERRFTIEGLENNATYTVRVLAVDEAGNVSDPSGELPGTPVETRGFFGDLVDSGSQERGGCSAAGGMAASGGVLALMALWAAARRRR